MIEISGAALRDFESASQLEWLEANGLGGWASSTVSGAHTRRYHGLLVAALAPPVGRTLVVSKLDETLGLPGGAMVELGANRWPDAVHPRGFRHLTSFSRGLFPVWRYEVGGAVIERTIAAIDGEPTTVVTYELVAGPEEVTLELRPFLTWRDVHALGPAAVLSDRVDSGDGELRWRPTPHAPELTIAAPGAGFEPEPQWWHRFTYPVEQRRGFDSSEDLWTPGTLTLRMRVGERVAVVLSLEPGDLRDGLALVETERARREGLLDRLPVREPELETLALAADQFIVRRGDDLRTIVAGYHWFADWGRDTMIALPGLCLATGRPDDARRILLAFADHVDQGMLPNRFPDGGEAPEYNTVDATLWYFVAIWRYLEATGDLELISSRLLEVLREIVDWHERGTRYGIRVDDDGLLAAGEPGVQLTWMDARVGDRVVTPRHGKPVEIQALWANALAILAQLERRVGERNRADRLDARVSKVRSVFARSFWNPVLGCLYDVIGDGLADGSLRPNQVIALALPFPVLGRVRSRSVLGVVDRELLTPVGLRSLAAFEPGYEPRYNGPPWRRDSAYHQGTVWSWLLGPWATATGRAFGAAGRRRARAHLLRSLDHLREAGVGTFSEIFEAEPPHAPRGAIAQAWSIGELLRVLGDSDTGDD